MTVSEDDSAPPLVFRLIERFDALLAERGQAGRRLEELDPDLFCLRVRIAVEGKMRVMRDVRERYERECVSVVAEDGAS